MISKGISVLLLAIALCGTAFAQRLPSYYPDQFQRIGTIDDVQDDTLVVNDIAYTLSESVEVHSLSDQRASLARLRPGTVIGYQVAGNRQIVEIWLLPSSYARARNTR